MSEKKTPKQTKKEKPHSSKRVAPEAGDENVPKKLKAVESEIRNQVIKQELDKLVSPADLDEAPKLLNLATEGAAGNKTIRHNIMNLWNDKDQSKLDRYMIAFYRLETEGRVKFRRLLGMHGGGGGTKESEFKEILESKMDKDLEVHYDGKYPDDFWWPEPSPNSPYPEKQPKSPFTYTFCWHQEPEFLIWHRPLMVEYEWLLQEYDPETFAKEEDRHKGPNALGAPYWAWETWDGLTLPVQISEPTYIVRTDKYKNKETGQFSKGSSFNNPLHRWFAPVTVKQQMEEYFPDVLNNTNCTTRSISFTDPSIPHELPWRIKDENGRPSMWNVVNHAMSQPDFKKFATGKPNYGDPLWSIEGPHNSFHNHIGGFTYGGSLGPGKQRSPIPNEKGQTEDYFTGTMTQNQSIFDPVFWLHHSNVERQLCSWQRIWLDNNKRPKEKVSEPEEAVMKRVLYPWTKPERFFAGAQSWNTKVDKANDATFEDWWKADLRYEYEEYHTAQHSFAGLRAALAAPQRVRLIAELAEKRRGGEYRLFFNGDLKSSISILSAVNSGCARCLQRDNRVDFDVTHFIPDTNALNNDIQGKLVLTRNDQVVEVRQWTTGII